MLTKHNLCYKNFLKINHIQNTEVDTKDTIIDILYVLYF
jgi:hypothetical protein